MSEQVRVNGFLTSLLAICHPLDSFLMPLLDAHGATLAEDVYDGERLVMRTAQGPFPMATTYTWSSEPDGSTRMTLRNRGKAAGFSKLMAPIMRPAIRRANRKDLALLKGLLESQAG